MYAPIRRLFWLDSNQLLSAICRFFWGKRYIVRVCVPESSPRVTRWPPLTRKWSPCITQPLSKSDLLTYLSVQGDSATDLIYDLIWSTSGYSPLLSTVVEISYMNKWSSYDDDRPLNKSIKTGFRHQTTTNNLLNSTKKKTISFLSI